MTYAESQSARAALWPIVLVLGITQIIGYGTLYYAFASVAPSVATELRVTEEVLFGYLSIGFLSGGLVAPFLGRLMDHVGAARVMTIGSLGNAMLFALAAYSHTALLFAAATTAMQVVSVSTAYDAAFATINQAAGVRAQKTITHLTLIAGLSSTVFWPVTGWLTDLSGWRGTYFVFAALHAFVCMPLHAFLWRRLGPPQHVKSVEQSRTSSEVESQPHGIRTFWMIAVSFAMSTALITALGTHLVSLLLAKDLGASSYTIAMCVGPAQVAIRIANVTIMRHLTALQGALVSALALPVSAAALLVANGAWVPALAFALVFGVGQGLFSITRGTVPLSLFGPQGYGKRLGQLAAVRTLLSAGAPFAFAFVWHRFNLDLALTISIVLGVLAAVPLMLVRRS